MTKWLLLVAAVACEVTASLALKGALDRPSAGSVHLGGDRDVAELGDRALTDLRATEIGFVFQSFNLIPTLTALENVETAFAGALAERSRGAVRQRVRLEHGAAQPADRGSPDASVGHRRLHVRLLADRPIGVPCRPQRSAHRGHQRADDSGRHPVSSQLSPRPAQPS